MMRGQRSLVLGIVVLVSSGSASAGFYLGSWSATVPGIEGGLQLGLSLYENGDAEFTAHHAGRHAETLRGSWRRPHGKQLMPPIQVNLFEPDGRTRVDGWELTPGEDMLRATRWNRPRYGPGPIVFHRAAVEAVERPVGLQGHWSRAFVGAGGEVRQSLELHRDGTAIIETAYPGERRGSVRTRSRWQQEADDLVRVWFGREGREADEMVFRLRRDRLEAREWNQNIHGRTRPVFSRDTETGPVVVAPVEVGPEGRYVRRFRGEQGEVNQQLDLLRDGTVVLEERYRKGRPVRSQGTWRERSNRVTLTLTSMNNRTIRDRWVLRADGVQLIAEKWDQDVHGAITPIFVRSR